MDYLFFLPLQHQLHVLEILFNFPQDLRDFLRHELLLLSGLLEFELYVLDTRLDRQLVQVNQQQGNDLLFGVNGVLLAVGNSAA